MWEVLYAPTRTTMDSRLPDSGYAALRRFRHSAPQTEYFLTFNLRERDGSARLHDLRDGVFAEAFRLESAGHWLVRTMVVMPDHLHLLVVLLGDCELSKVIRSLRGRLAPLLRLNALHWQDGFYDRRLREQDDRAPIFLYIFLNPYRAGLIERNERWPAYYCRPEDWAWFGELTDADCPMPEWLG